jgi:hypothetical protein
VSRLPELLTNASGVAPKLSVSGRDELVSWADAGAIIVASPQPSSFCHGPRPRGNRSILLGWIFRRIELIDSLVGVQIYIDAIILSGAGGTESGCIPDYLCGRRASRLQRDRRSCDRYAGLALDIVAGVIFDCVELDLAFAEG